MTPTETGHAADATLVALLHGEAAPAAALHVAGCASCRARLEALGLEEQDAASLLAALDHPMSAPGATPWHAASGPRHRIRTRRPRTLVRIAVTGGLLAATALAAAALPFSPVHRWLVQSRAVPASLPAPSNAAPTGASAVAPLAGVVIPHPTTMRIVLERSQPSGVMQITRGSGADVRVRARGGDVGYDVSDSGVTIDNRLPATEYDIELPRALAGVTIDVGSVRIYPVSDSTPPPVLRIPLGNRGKP
jgi:hypothetical protein